MPLLGLCKLMAVLALGDVQLPLAPTRAAAEECEPLVAREGDLYVLGLFRVCDTEPDSFDLQLYVLAQAFRFAVQHASPDGAGSLGYKLVTYCEQPPGCSEKILDEMDRAHREGAQTIVTIFYAGTEPARSLFVNVLQVEINLSQIRIHRSTLKINFRGALPSILGPLKAFQWNVVGFIHRYELEARDVITGLEQSDQGEICIEFTEQSIFDGQKLMDKISSSKSNVTLVMDESALYYMSRAGQEENRTTEKHIIHCCYGVTFGLAGLEYKVFQGMWSLHQRPRLVPGFLDYLLDANTHPSANATVGYLFRKACHQCTANPSSENPCRNFNDPGPVNISAARLSHRDPDICLGAPAINMCHLCLDRLAYLDVIFIMDLFMQKLARAIEELSQNYPPSRPQNSSDFNREHVPFHTTKSPSTIGFLATPWNSQLKALILSPTAASVLTCT